MDAKPTKPPETPGSMAHIHDRATSTIIDAIEPSPPPTGRPWVGGAVYAPRAARFDESGRTPADPNAFAPSRPSRSCAAWRRRASSPLA